MQLSTSDVRKVAALAKLEVAEGDLGVLSRKLLSVLDFVDQLKQADTSGIEEMAHPVDVHSVLRHDQVGDVLSRESALQNAPRTDGEFFLVPPVLG